ncbi:phosphotransferase enzyme family protein [Candidatus Uabimicrobium sp. HlEnr_7]|uniref:phosphotransferase enzyme family protein n=1 Tax=Candidatus Uabimicrobium helgolandensis TaxID=3095367 RepID=UPI0035585239
MIPFSEASERSQAYRLRKLAMEALKHYPLAIQKVHFIQNGENATFQVLDKSNNKYLLRIFRYGYHTTEAIKEELDWLIAIGNTTNIKVPQPIKTIKEKCFVTIKHPAMTYARHCAIFKWVEGRFLWKYTNTSYMKKLGRLIGKLQQTGRKQKIHHRNYWTVDGLIGKNAKFGNLEDVIGIPKKQHDELLRARNDMYKKLKEYEINNPQQSGFMHGDLHFGNFVVHKGELGAIDFDDSGVGLHHYDLAIPMRSLAYFTEHEKRDDIELLSSALFEGYAEFMPFTENDVQNVVVFQAVRQLVMLPWLHSRSDVARLRKRIPKAAKNALDYIKKNL